MYETELAYHCSITKFNYEWCITDYYLILLSYTIIEYDKLLKEPQFDNSSRQEGLIHSQIHLFLLLWPNGYNNFRFFRRNGSTWYRYNCSKQTETNLNKPCQNVTSSLQYDEDGWHQYKYANLLTYRTVPVPAVGFFQCFSNACALINCRRQQLSNTWAAICKVSD